MSAVAVERSVAVIQSLGVHVVFALVMVFGLSVSSESVLPKFPATIQATVVDRQAIVDARQARKDLQQEQLRSAAAERRRQQQAEQEVQRQQVQKKQEQEAAIQKRRDDQAAAQRRMDQEKRKQREREKQLAELKRQQEDARRQSEREKQRLDQLEAEKRAQDQQRQQALEEERRKQLLALESQQRDQQEFLTLEQEWVAVVYSMVSANWQRPPTAEKGLRCMVQVHQAPGGSVLDASVLPGCNGDDATRRSIVNAVLRSDPLPYKGYEKIFKRQFKFEFVY
jgi:colicin import membrane protein